MVRGGLALEGGEKLSREPASDGTSHCTFPSDMALFKAQVNNYN